MKFGFPALLLAQYPGWSDSLNVLVWHKLGGWLANHSLTQSTFVGEAEAQSRDGGYAAIDLRLVETACPFPRSHNSRSRF